MQLVRRDVLCGSVFLGYATLTGCTDEGTISGSDRDAGGEPAGDLNDLELESLDETLSFSGEDEPLNVPVGQGWDGRLFTEISTLTDTALVTENDRFYLRTFFPDRLDESAPWVVRIDGLVEAAVSVTIDEIVAEASDQGRHLMECSGNFRGGSFGLMSVAEWTGVPLASFLERARPSAGASRVLVSGFDDHSVPSAGMHSTPGASWIFSPEDLESTGAFLATHMNGERISKDHGFPLRLVVPGWFGCTCIKWVDRVAWVSEDEPATSQMIEFATRTHQTAAHELGRDYAPATIEQSAMPIRVEKWRGVEGIVYRVVGILWGGTVPVTRLSVSFDAGQSYVPVALDEPVSSRRSWMLWERLWRPAAAGTYAIQCRVDDPGIPQRRLDSGYYLREVVIDEV